MLLREALQVSQDLHSERIFTLFSLLTNLCKLMYIKSTDVSSESFILLKEKLYERYIQFWSDRIKNI